MGRQQIHPEPLVPWEFQDQLDRLVRHGYARIDERATEHQRMRAADGEPLLHVMYEWTEEGKNACPEYRYSTPMSWAWHVMKDGEVRHCIVCGRSTVGMRVYARSEKRANKRTVCMACGQAAGWMLSDLDG